MPKLSKKSLLIILGVLVVLLGGAYVLLLSLKSKKPAPVPHAELTYWGVYDSPEIIQPIIDKYQTLHPNITIHYEQKEVGKEDRVGSYEKDLIDAFAGDNGPDIFELQNMMIPKYQSLIIPYPDAKIIDEYFDVVSKDALIKNQVYGLPYSVDSLALYYNKRLFKDAGIVDPPRTWEDFDSIVENDKLKSLDSTGKFLQAGAAIGGSNLRINRATDILAALMLQSGTPITDANKDRLIWDEPVTDPEKGTTEHPALKVLNKYLRYSNALDPTYTWNESQAYSFDLFAQEKVAMVISYAFQLPTILGNNPKMQFGIAPLPQPKGANQKITYANYWLQTVSAQSHYPEIAWDFLRFATNQENDKLYSSATNKPVSRKDLIKDEMNDANLSAFALQNLYATSWYQYDGPLVEKILDSMLRSILNGKATSEDAFKTASQQIQSVLTNGGEIRQQIEASQQKAQEAAKAVQNANNSTKK